MCFRSGTASIELSRGANLLRPQFDSATTENVGAYTATKTGVNGFCEALREEVAADGVRVTVVMPGVVDTDMQPTEFEHEVLTPADVADTIIFALSRPDNVLLADLLVTPSPPVPYR